MAKFQFQGFETFLGKTIIYQGLADGKIGAADRADITLWTIDCIYKRLGEAKKNTGTNNDSNSFKVFFN